jgi:hypothetical protein
MMGKINSWQFECPRTGQLVNVKMKFQDGWINNIRAFRELWKMCQAEGFQYLRTRAVNQDCLENLFSIIRQNGMGNTNPSCYQFAHALKTSVLNNLTGSFCRDKNCEDDDGNLLSTLEEFLDNGFTLAKPIVDDHDNELLTINVPNFNENSLKDENLDTQGLSYVCGYFVKKIKAMKCVSCLDALLSQNLELHHIFTSFKENDGKTRLKYVQKSLIRYIPHAYDLIYHYLNESGEILNIFQKIKVALKCRLDFTWFYCKDHFSETESILLDSAISLIAIKFLKDKRKQFENDNRQMHQNNKMRRILHK